MNGKVTLVPDAHLLLESLRSVGYAIEMAIADIVDNSISAGASNIDLVMEWASEQSRILIIDNGCGMTQDELISSMKIGSADPKQIRSAEDLGRFGMGMKTAAFSMGKRLCVFSKKNHQWTNACWDLECIQNECQGNWSLLIDNDMDQAIADKLSDFECGTVVVIEKLDRVITNFSEKAHANFIKTIEQIEKHLSLVFHRFLEKEVFVINLSMNIASSGHTIIPWNPFLISNNATQELSEECPWGISKNVSIRPYVLPHKTKFSSTEEFNEAGGVRGWLGQQGFYLYRNERLIVYGTWFRIFKREPAFNLARICVDIESDSDYDWKIDIKKSTATPPFYMRELLEKTAMACSERSARVYNSRGTYTNHKTSHNLEYVWEQRRNQSGKYGFFLNKKHPLLTKLREHMSQDDSSLLHSYLALVEGFPPFMLSGVADEYVNSNKQTEPENAADPQAVALLEEIKNYITIYQQLGYSQEEVKVAVLSMPNYRSIQCQIQQLFEEDSL